MPKGNCHWSSTQSVLVHLLCKVHETKSQWSNPSVWEYYIGFANTCFRRLPYGNVNSRI